MGRFLAEYMAEGGLLGALALLAWGAWAAMTKQQ